MQIFKFGGASVKDADSVKNVVSVLNQVGYNNTLIVVSAMGKMTNHFESIVDAYLNNNNQLPPLLTHLKEFHYTICDKLFNTQDSKVYTAIDLLLHNLDTFISTNNSTHRPFVYDQIVCYGELLSSTVLSYYLNTLDIHNTLLDVRNVISTNSNYRDAIVDFAETEQNINEQIEADKLYVTQGFIGSDSDGYTTTLGREGSDYTAAILAYCLSANSVTIWKDVAGVLNADPRYFEHTTLLENISYSEAIELAFYGASIIHPKTLKPLQNKSIPLHVKSFLDPLQKGTCVFSDDGITPKVPCFIVKRNQILISLSSLNFSFIVEKHIAQIFDILYEYGIKVDLIQNSAISFTICVNDKFFNFKKILPILQKNFKVAYNDDVCLYTIRHYDKESIMSITNGKNVLLKQQNRATVQIVI